MGFFDTLLNILGQVNVFTQLLNLILTLLRIFGVAV